MNSDILLGLQWGDEGKGKIVDAITPKYDVVARFQGGPNAGHSLEFNNKKYVLHLIPSGIFHPNKLNVIGNGVVIDPSVFKKEIEELDLPLDEVINKLIISSRANLILPIHRILDAANEKSKGTNKIGSTLRGIGPAYTDKISRNGLRVGDILSNDFKKRYDEHTASHLATIGCYDFEFDLAKYEEGWFEGVETMAKFRIENSEYLLNNLLDQGKKILAEGAQGTMLDIDFGSYPFVTSSNTISAGACTGLGIPPKKIGEVFGIFKAYCTRVGSGPFPTELFDSTGEDLRKAGFEFGATTGRPRRCGWLDLPELKYAITINGVTQLFMTKSDVLSGFDTIKVCTSYIVDGKKTNELPFMFDNVNPVYEEFPGWNEDITKIKEFDNLPENLKDYINYIEKYTGVPITIVSVGPDREETIVR
jgi:adenylosuccinate synthase